MGDNQPALKIAPQREQFDSHAHVFFENRLQAMNKPQKVLDMEARLSKFKEEKVKQEMSARNYHLEQ